jgi:hypothetical protein
VIYIITREEKLNTHLFGLIQPPTILSSVLLKKKWGKPGIKIDEDPPSTHENNLMPIMGMSVWIRTW